MRLSRSASLAMAPSCSTSMRRWHFAQKDHLTDFTIGYRLVYQVRDNEVVVSVVAVGSAGIRGRDLAFMPLKLLFLLYILPMFFLWHLNGLPFGRFVAFFEFNINVFIGNGARAMARIISNMLSRPYFDIIRDPSVT